MASAVATNGAVASAPNGVMALYWELASVDPAVRQTAAESLVRSLNTFQQEHDSTHTTRPAELTESNLEEFCAQDVVYGLKRLLRGLPSSRDGARQGFAVALTELLRQLEFLTAGTILALLTKLTQTEGAKGQEEREILFGRIFGLMAICQAGMISRASTTIEDVQTIVTSLLKYASSKSYLRETCFCVLITMSEELTDGKLEEEAIAFMIPAVLKNGVEDAEDLWFALVMQSRYPKFDWASVLPTWKHAQLLHPKNQSQLIELLKQSTHTSPRIHSVWDTLLDLLTSESAAGNTVSLSDIWINLDDALYSSTHERKHLGLNLFQRVLARAKPTEIPFVFTPQLLRTLINNLSKQDNYLHKVAKQTATALSKLAQERKEIALQLVLQLVGKHGHQRFDAVTKTKTVESILGSLEAADIISYVQYLEDLFVDQTEEAAAEVPYVDSHRHWVLDQMLQLVRNAKVPKEEKWVQSVARFICLHAFFDVTKADAKNSSIKPAQPPLSEATRTLCQEKLFALLGALVALQLKNDEGKPLHAGCLKNGELWARDLHDFVQAMQKSKHVTLAVGIDNEAKAALDKTAKILSEIRVELKKLDGAQNRDLQAQYKAFELILVHVSLQVYTDPEETVGVLTELENCYTLLFNSKRKASKKRKNADDDEEEHEPVEVLLDVLISFLAKPSALLRTLSQEVFKVFSSKLTKKALDLMFDVLTAKGGVAGAQELFEDEDEGEDDHMDIDGQENGEVAGESSEEEDDDEDEEEGDEQDNPKVDEELRLKIKDALGSAAVDGDADDSDEGEFLDDEQMGEFDSKLAEIFKQRKEIKSAKKDLKQQVLHFKFRVVDLFDLFLRKAPQSPLVVEMIMPLLKLLTATARSADDQGLHEKLHALVKNRLFKLKEIPTEPSLDADRAAAVLTEVHEYARKAADSDTVSLCSGASLLLVKILSHCKEPVAASALTPKKTPKKRKVEADSATTVKPLSRVATAYAESLTNFMATKSRLKPVFFLELVSRYPAYGWELMPKVVELAAPSAGAKAYPLGQAYTIIFRLVTQMPKKDEAERIETIRQVWPKFVDDAIATFKEALEEGNARTLKKERTKALVKELVAMARKTVHLFKKEEIASLWKVPDLQKQLNVLCDNEKFATGASLKGQRDQLLSILKGESGKKK
ncbi:DNA polymerase phi-domain-containing protein [Fimicolochytrium jonesii]|uniref:DNA polymerase phi-domain-containing protein n=1 Tax=Fimicolochytrium jonesii TaxID=1396493 RepID=UPI0022FE6AC5|nr:DNA polymerase phi-domain-containing protein [Fimicolochytrium jonesii]KAI8825821.1 DNA polymerase phi-domain-containing protein [Fimicolochytrium jonesii]